MPQISQKISVFALVIVACILSSGSAYATQSSVQSCVADFMVQQKTMPHGLSRDQLNQLEALSRSGDIGGGWALLGQWGDPYAKRAAQIINPPVEGIDNSYHRVVKENWLNTVGQKNYDDFFLRVAQQHFNQYLQILETGNWPDSDQILNSYLAASRMYDLPDAVDFDSVWLDSGIQTFQTWEGAVGLQKDRIVRHSNICTSTHSVRAFFLVFHDLIQLL